MDAFLIHGGKRLRGRVHINGSKNASLPLMAAALLTDEPVIIRDVPDLSDIQNMRKLLTDLGCDSVASGESMLGTAELRLQTTDESQSVAKYDIVKTMRASICTLGPLLAKRGEASVSMPGGCNIGERPVDLHLRGLKALGAQIALREGYIIAKAPPGGRLRGNRVFLGGPFGSTVLGTANVMCAAVLAQGTTIIESAACEPEIEDLAHMLQAMGAKIIGAGSPRITIHGVDKLHGVDYTVMADRIEAGTYIMAAAITNGDVILDNCPTDSLIAVIDRLQEVGVYVESLSDDPNVLSTASAIAPSLAPVSTNGSAPYSNGTATAVALAPARNGTSMKTSAQPVNRLRDTIRISSSRRLSPVEVVTQPFPGFPTDLQAQIMALLCLADGNSIITEKIFPDRFMHVAELSRMGASVARTGSSAVITGIKQFEGAPVMASDLRASAGLIIAGLAAKGTTVVSRVYHLDRGYERMELTLQALGADIERINEK